MIITKRKKRNFGFWGSGFSVLLLAALLGFAAGNFRSGSQEDARVALTDAVRKMAVHCYAIEGEYPQDVGYLEANYGLTYNHDRYTVHYEVIGANLLPDIFVTEAVDDD